MIIFILKNKDMAELVIHCDYGQWKSPAVAIFAEKLKVENNFKQKYPGYNNYVLDKLLTITGLLNLSLSILQTTLFIFFTTTTWA